MNRATILFLTFGLLTACANLRRTETEAKPRISIVDNAQMLPAAAQDSLSDLINKLEEEMGSQIAVVTTTRLAGQTIDEFGQTTFNGMKLGRAEYNDGVLISIALLDRKVRIDVGTGLENIIKDEIANRYLRNDLGPKFRQEKFGEGLYITIEKMSKLIRENEERIGQRPEYLDRWDSVKRTTGSDR